MNTLECPTSSPEVTRIDYQDPLIGQSSVGSTTYFFLDEEIPASFIEALNDFHAGRVVSLEQALNDPFPPDA